ncbi:MAG: Cupin 2 conserved barrel domain protein, partial [Thermomicrobiales bacterium]|nr:Cupin 2 conserved barrel domain protein [Thermomicrobiales bacterium]
MPITITVENRWWPTLDARALDLLEQGATLTDAERAQAEFEREARARRVASPPFIRRNDIHLQPSSHRGVFIGDIVAAHMNVETHMLAAQMQHLPPGVHTERHRHGERLMHVMTGTGHSIIDGERYDWEPGDSIHIKTGFWHQHFNTGADPANFFVASASPLLERIVPFPLIYKGDSFSDVSDDFQPEHPFGLGPQEIVPVDPNEKWNSSVHLNRKERVAALEARARESRTMLKWNQAKIERSQHKGDF